MKAFFKDMFEYHHYFNQKLVTLLIENSDRINGKVIPLFSHIMNAHQVWNSRILDHEPLGVNQIHTLEACQSIDNSNYQHTLQILDEFDLQTIVTYRNTKGNEFKNTIQEILFQAANHSTHHRGQIVYDLRLNNIEPPMTDYIFYKRL
jgi:uncharacterized damage-inducible protein DinB